jgi:hypothetical protein
MTKFPIMKYQIPGEIKLRQPTATILADIHIKIQLRLKYRVEIARHFYEVKKLEPSPCAILLYRWFVFVKSLTSAYSRSRSAGMASES